MKIRKATKKDLKEILKLELKLVKHVKNFDKDINLQRSERALKRLYSELPKNFIVIVAEENNKIIGFISADTHKNSGWGYNYAWVDDLFVEEQYRRKGIAIELISKLLDILKKEDIRIFKLGVDIENKIAQKLWKKVGFKEQDLVLKKKI